MSAVRQISFGLVIACGFSVPAMADAIVTNIGSGSAINCLTSDVQVTSYQQVLGGTNSWSGTADSTACIGAYDGNNKPAPDEDLNIGTAGDGLFNGEEQQTGDTHILFDPGAFIDDGTNNTNVLMQNIAEFHEDGDVFFDPDGPVNDPGWIELGKIDMGEDGGYTTNDVLGQSIITDKFFSVTCDDDSEDCRTGTWALTPPADGPAALQWLLETFLPGYDGSGYKTGYFDAFTILLKAGDGFAAYLFTAEDFGINYIDTVYNFWGTFDTRALDAGLSHIAFYAHDPLLPGNDVPEPAALVLLSTGLIGLFGFARARAGKSL